MRVLTLWLMYWGIFLDEVFENDVLGDVELDNVFDEVVNDVANNVIVI